MEFSPTAWGLTDECTGAKHIHTFSANIDTVLSYLLWTDYQHTVNRLKPRNCKDSVAPSIVWVRDLQLRRYITSTNCHYFKNDWYI